MLNRKKYYAIINSSKVEENENTIYLPLPSWRFTKIVLVAFNGIKSLKQKVDTVGDHIKLLNKVSKM